MITLSTQLVNSMSPAFVCLIYLLLFIPSTIPFCWSACLSGLEFMALYLLGLDLIFLTGHSVRNVMVNFHSLTTVATVYLKALFWDLSSFHCSLHVSSPWTSCHYKLRITFLREACENTAYLPIFIRCCLYFHLLDIIVLPF